MDQISYDADGVSSLSPAALSHARQEAANSALAASGVTAKPLEANRAVLHAVETPN
jgi:hypothetical protein